MDVQLGRLGESERTTKVCNGQQRQQRKAKVCADSEGPSGVFSPGACTSPSHSGTLVGHTRGASPKGPHAAEGKALSKVEEAGGGAGGGGRFDSYKERQAPVRP
jgi:hypothetical protein